MTKNVQELLLPILIISYVCGLRIIKFPVGDLRQWFNFLYILLLWVFYNLIIMYTMSYTVYYSTEYHICTKLHILTTLISTVIGIYYDKIFRSCIKKLTIVDDTLKKVGIKTNYHKFKMKIVWLVFGWTAIIIFLTCLECFFLKKQNMDVFAFIFIPFMRNYTAYINYIGVLIIMIMLSYTALKFDQINKYLKKLSEDNTRRIKVTWEHSMLRSHKSRFPKALSNKIWIVMHLHLELRKISRKIDSIFGIQMTLEIGCYFTFIATISKELFRLYYTKPYYTNNPLLFIVIILFWFPMYIFRLFLINYICEWVSTKANETRDFINKFSYTTCDIEIRENILQFLLQTTQSPLKFYGIGLFQFGFKFLYGFLTSVLTVLVIYTQAFTSSQHINNN